MQTLSERFRAEDGTAGAGILWFSLCVIFGALAMDITNAYRAYQMLIQTADTAAHAGAVAIAYGADNQQIRDAVLAEIEANMPASKHGRLVLDAGQGIQLLHYDPEADTVSPQGKTNAVLVTLRRDHVSGNVVPMIMMSLMDVFDGNGEDDYKGWVMQHSSTATMVETMECKSGNYFYARGTLELTSQNHFGARYCLHSQGDVWMPQQNTFAEAAGISMPDLEACGSKCNDDANPGAEAAAFETNLLAEPLGGLIARIEADFLSGGPESDDFFYGRSLDSDLTPLSDIGYVTTDMAKGDVVTLSKSQFEGLPRVPYGLTYFVDCNHGGQPLDVAVPTGAGVFRDTALITDCALKFNGAMEIHSAILLTTKSSANANVTASSGARVGTHATTCEPDRHTWLYTVGEVHVPADFVASNVTIVAQDDIQFAAASSSSSLPHVGLSMITDGEMHIAAGHNLTSCAKPPDGKTPALRVIRQIEPQLAPTNVL